MSKQIGHKPKLWWNVDRPAPTPTAPPVPKLPVRVVRVAVR